MGSKVFLLLGFLMAIVLLISSEVAARDLAETSLDHNQNAGETNGVEDRRGGYGEDEGHGGYGGGRGGYPGGGRGGYPGGGGGGNRGYPGGGRGGRGCRYGCCGRGYYGRGCRCCSYAGEAVDAEAEAKPHN